MLHPAALSYPHMRRSFYYGWRGKTRISVAIRVIPSHDLPPARLCWLGWVRRATCEHVARVGNWPTRQAFLNRAREGDGRVLAREMGALSAYRTDSVHGRRRPSPPFAALSDAGAYLTKRAPTNCAWDPHRPEPSHMRRSYLFGRRYDNSMHTTEPSRSGIADSAPL